MFPLHILPSERLDFKLPNNWDCNLLSPPRNSRKRLKPSRLPNKVCSSSLSRCIRSSLLCRCREGQVHCREGWPALVIYYSLTDSFFSRPSKRDKQPLSELRERPRRLQLSPSLWRRRARRLLRCVKLKQARPSCSRYLRTPMSPIFLVEMVMCC